MMRVFADALLKQLREDKTNYMNDVAFGRCTSFDEYQKLCGLIQGLGIAEQHVLDLANNLENSDD